MTARAGGKGREMYGRVPEDAPPPGGWYPVLSVGEAPAAGRPAPLLQVLPQEQVQRRTVEQIFDPVRRSQCSM